MWILQQTTELMELGLVYLVIAGAVTAFFEMFR